MEICFLENHISGSDRIARIQYALPYLGSRTVDPSELRAVIPPIRGSAVGACLLAFSPLAARMVVSPVAAADTAGCVPHAPQTKAPESRRFKIPSWKTLCEFQSI